MAKCELCERFFYTKSTNKKYCSDVCRKVAITIKNRKKEQLCWTCKSTCYECCWRSHLIPVKGWSAKPLRVKDREGEIRSYRITGCPLYKPTEIKGE